NQGDALDVPKCSGLFHVGCRYSTSGLPYPERNQFRGPGFWNMDFNVYKDFKLTERVGLQFRAEVYNIFNQSNQYVATENLDFFFHLLLTRHRRTFGRLRKKVHNKLSVTLLFAASFAVSSALASDSDRTDGNSANTAAISTSNKSESTLSNHRPGIAFKTSLLGFGGDVAVPMTRRSNVRVGFAAFNYGRGFDKDGVSYSGRLNLRSMQALYDIFPFGGGFHLSPGVMMYSGNQLSGSAIV